MERFVVDEDDAVAVAAGDEVADVDETDEVAVVDNHNANSCRVEANNSLVLCYSNRKAPFSLLV